MAAKNTASKKPAAAKNDGPRPLNGRMIKLLEALASGKPLTRTKLSEKAGVEIAATGDLLGRMDPAARKISDETYGKPSLLTRGHVKFSQLDVDGAKETVWEITPKGKQALAAAKADAKEKAKAKK